MNDRSHILSPAAERLASANDENVYARLVVPAAPHGTAAEGFRTALSSLTADNVLRAPPRSAEAAQALLAGLWLRYDFLDESHTISQSLSNTTGSFWHAIMHRREGDFSNAKYWYARCRGHPVLRELGNEFDATALVDLAQQVHDSPTDTRYVEAVRLQRLEWDELFDYCLREASGLS